MAVHLPKAPGVGKTMMEFIEDVVVMSAEEVIIYPILLLKEY